MAERPHLYSPYDEPFWDSVAEHKMRLQKCSGCGSFRYPPGPMCPDCMSFESTWEPVSGKAKIMAWTVFHRKYLPEYPPPTLCVTVMLEEGPMMVSNMPAEFADGLALDQEVELYYETHPNGFELPRFKPKTA